MTEVLSQREPALRFLDFVGNHERKLGFAAVILAEPEKPHSAASIRDAYNDQQGSSTEWKLKRTGDMKEILEQCFVPGGVLREDVAGKYRVNQEVQELYSSLSGFLTGWSLDNPDVSLQQLLGFTGSPGAVRCPRARFQIYGHLLEYKNPRISRVAKIFRQIGYKTAEGVERQIEVMKDAGLVDIEALAISGLFVKLGELPSPRSALPEVKALREMLQQFPEGSEMMLDEIMSQFRVYYPASDDVHVTFHDTVARYLKAYGHYLGLTPLPRGNGHISRVTIAEEIEEPVQDLFNGIQGQITNGPAKKHIAYARSLAQGNGQGDFGQLIAKGRLFSSHGSQMDGKDLKDDILKVLTEEWVSVRAIRAAIKSRKLSVIYLRKLLNKMARADVIDARLDHLPTREEGALSDGRIRLTRRYRIR